MNVLIREETPADRSAIGQVNLAAFGQQAEADLVDALRDQGDIVLSMVATDADDAIVGHILFSRMKIVTESSNLDALSLAPMAVLPDRQRQGIGSQLVDSGLKRCRELDERIVVVLGHPEYYPRFGFDAQLAQRLVAPFDVPAEAWMALELTPKALADVHGRVEYSPAFGALE